MSTKPAKKFFLHRRLTISIVIIFLVIPLIIVIGATLFNDRKYNLISIIIVFLACVPFFFAFEKRKPQPREMLIIAVMAGISSAGRFVFAMVPGFKPVTAVTAITGIAFGAEAGFLTGALSAVVSNMYFGQGPWTPFQMFTWGLLGFIAGLLGKTGVMKYKVSLILYGILSGVLYSFCMDIWVVMSYDGLFVWEKYLAATVTAMPFIIIYALSNVIFLLILAKPLLLKLERVKIKYGIM